MEEEIFTFDCDTEEVTVEDSSCTDTDSVEILESNGVSDPSSSMDNSCDDIEIIEINGATVGMNPEQSKLTRDDFEFQKVIGLGGYGKVYLAVKTTGKDRGTVCAMKVLQKAKILRSIKEVDHCKTERNILRMISHPFIVKLLYAFQTEGRLYLGLEFMSGGELFWYLNNEHYFFEDTAKFYMCELILALEHLHSHGIIYRDLKSENILLDSEGHIKLTDFGLCKENIDGDVRTNTFCGTIDHMAPEMFKECGHNKAVDWWSLGILLFDMVNGHPPFKARNKREAMEKISKLKLKFKKYVTETAQDLIRKLLRKEASKRLGCGPCGANEIKEHEFFDNVDWEAVIQKRLEPPYKPVVRGVEDVSNFDKKFTSMSSKESPDNFKLSESAKDVFQGFSYTDDRLLNGNHDDILNNRLQNIEENVQDIEMIDIS